MRKAAGTYFPFGIGYISAYVKQYGYDVHFFDPNVQEIELSDMVEFIQTKKPLLVGISFMTPQFFAAQKIVDAIKQANKKIPVVLGGAHPSVMPQRTLKEIPNADYVAYGEGEQTMLALMEFLSHKKGSLDTIRGLSWRDGVRIVLNPPHELIENLDDLPFPDRELIDQSLYYAQSFLSYSKKSITIYTSRGCPGRCTFCASGHKLRSRIRERSIKNVIEEIDFLIKRYGANYLLIKDDTFTLRKSRIKEFCEAIKGRYSDLKWHCMVRANSVDEDLLAMMREVGLNDVFIGIESGNNEILKNVKKGITTEQVRKVVEACDSQGIRSYGAFILGLPGETYKTITQTINFACSLPLTMAGFSVLIPYPGTRIFEDYYNDNETIPINYKNFIASSGVNFVEGYTGLEDVKLEELPRLISSAQKRFYLRPSQIFRLFRAANPAMLLGYIKGFFALLNKELFILRKSPEKRV
jgi:radical SAM superfamily enzyme YgiQ (UPF0313 family)